MRLDGFREKFSSSNVLGETLTFRKCQHSFVAPEAHSGLKKLTHKFTYHILIEMAKVLSLREIQSEQLAQKLGSLNDAQLAQALQRNEDTATAGITVAEVDSSHDADYALALKLAAEFEAEAAAAELADARRQHGLSITSSVRLVSSRANGSAWGRQGPRQMYSADDAESLAASNSGSAGGGPSVMLNAAEVAAIRRDERDDAARDALRGRGLLIRRGAADSQAAQASGAGAANDASAAGSDRLISKHDAELAGRLNSRALERSLPAVAGDLRDTPISSTAVRRLCAVFRRMCLARKRELTHALLFACRLVPYAGSRPSRR